MGTGVSPSHSIVTQIATIEDVPPTDLEPPLHDVIDPDALDRLLDSNYRHASDESVSVEFTYRGHSVYVDATGTVDIDPSDGRSDSNTGSGSESGVESPEDVHGD